MSMDMKMGAPAAKFNPSKNDSIKVMKKYAMDMGGMKMDHSKWICKKKIKCRRMTKDGR